MSDATLTALHREGKPKALRRAGMIPGALASKELPQSIPVQFEEAALKKVLSVHGTSAKLFVSIDGKKHFGIIDEVQKDITRGAIVHVHVRLLSQDEQITEKLTVSYTGLAEIEHFNLMLIVHHHKVELTGKASMLPEHIIFNVKDLHMGDTVKVGDLAIDKSLKVHESPDLVLATVEEKKAIVIEEPVKPAETATAEAGAPAAPAAPAAESEKK